MSISKKFLFFLSNQPNPRFIKQINFLAERYEVTVIHYYREFMGDLSRDYTPQVVANHNLGVIPNGKYFLRIFYYLRSLWELIKIIRPTSYDVVLVNNVDMLVLYHLATCFCKLRTFKAIIEISDLRLYTYSTSIKSLVMRFFDKLIYNFVDKLIVTSPKFIECYYSHIFCKEIFVLENKPLSYMLPNYEAKINNDKIVIGIVGLLIQGKMYIDLLEQMKGNDRFEIHIYGRGTFSDMLKSYAAEFENIKYFGEYQYFQDIAKIYSSLDILYMPYDTENGSLNNRVALPNKLYEAMYYKVPIITSRNTYLGEIVDKYGIGKVFQCGNASDLLSCCNSDFSLCHDNFKSLPENCYLADNDYKKLQKYISC